MLRKFQAYNDDRLALWEDMLKENSDPVSTSEDDEHLVNKITKARRFLEDFKQRPQGVTIPLANKILTILKKYCDDYYVQDEIYQNLFNVDDIIQTILNFEPQQENLDQNALWRERYALLCGFIWQLIPENAMIFSFNDTLTLLIQQIHLTNYEKIDGSLNDFNCKNKFLNFNAQFPDLFKTAKDKLDQQRIADYQYSLTHLKRVCEQTKDSELSSPGLLLADAIEAEVGKNIKRKLKKLHFYESMIKTARKTIEDPKANAGQLVDYLPSSFNNNRLTNRLSAALLFFGGAALVTLSCLAIAGTLGWGLGFAVPGLFFGSGLIVAGSYMATSSKLPTFKNPFAFFKQKNENVYKAIEVFDQAEKQANKSSAP